MAAAVQIILTPGGELLNFAKITMSRSGLLFLHSEAGRYNAKKTDTQNDELWQMKCDHIAGLYFNLAAACWDLLGAV